MVDYTGISASTTAAQNQVVAVNSVTRSIQYISGQYTSLTYAGAQTVQIFSGVGRLVNTCVVISGGGTVQFYNTASTTALPANSLLFVLDASAPTGVTQIGLQFTDGIAVVIGAGVSVNVTYSVGS
jgi:hypothetical protein